MKKYKVEFMYNGESIYRTKCIDCDKLEGKMDVYWDGEDDILKGYKIETFSFYRDSKENYSENRYGVIQYIDSNGFTLVFTLCK